MCASAGHDPLGHESTRQMGSSRQATARRHTTAAQSGADSHPGSAELYRRVTGLGCALKAVYRSASAGKMHTPRGLARVVLSPHPAARLCDATHDTPLVVIRHGRLSTVQPFLPQQRGRDNGQCMQPMLWNRDTPYHATADGWISERWRPEGTDRRMTRHPTEED